jgi:hypothetical protein
MVSPDEAGERAPAVATCQMRRQLAKDAGEERDQPGLHGLRVAPFGEQGTGGGRVTLG